MDQFKVILGKDCLEENYGKLLLDSAENANVQITAGFLTAVMSPHQCPFFFFFFFFSMVISKDVLDIHIITFIILIIYC